MPAGEHTVIGFWLSTVEADVALVDAADETAATMQRFEDLKRADGRLPPDWLYVATFSPTGDPALAALDAERVGPATVEEQGGEGESVWVVGLAVSTEAAKIIRRARPQPVKAVEDVLDRAGGDLQFVVALDAAMSPVHTCEGFDVDAISRAAGG